MSRETVYEDNPTIGFDGNRQPIKLKAFIDANGWDARGILGDEARRLARSPKAEAHTERPEVPESSARPAPFAPGNEVVRDVPDARTD